MRVNEQLWEFVFNIITVGGMLLKNGKKKVLKSRSFTRVTSAQLRKKKLLSYKIGGIDGSREKGVN